MASLRLKSPALTLLNCRLSTLAPVRRTYFTATAAAPPAYSRVETAILAAAYQRVPATGFSVASLRQGALDAGYLPASINLFPRGAFDLVLYHLVSQRLALKDRALPGKLGTGAKVRALVLARLHANGDVCHKLPEALGYMSLLGNLSESTAELARLVDDIWYISGDTSVDSSWYTKRGLLAGVYASAELYMTRDSSKGFRDTEDFVDRRLEEVQSLGSSVGAVAEWAAFTGLASVNVLRSWGAKI